MEHAMKKTTKVRIAGPVKPGTRIAKGVPMGGPLQWFNPTGEDFEVERILTPWIASLLARGDVRLVKTPVPKKPKSTQKQGDSK